MAQKTHNIKISEASSQKCLWILYTLIYFNYILFDAEVKPRLDYKCLKLRGIAFRSNLFDNGDVREIHIFLYSCISSISETLGIRIQCIFYLSSCLESPIEFSVFTIKAIRYSWSVKTRTAAYFSMASKYCISNLYESISTADGFCKKFTV